MEGYSRPHSRPWLHCCATLIFLLTGCASVSPHANDTDMSVSEEDVEVGYGTLPIRHVTGSVAYLDMDDVNQSSISRLGDLLESRFAGVNVRRTRGSGYSVTVRGTSSLFGTNEPLYVVDGVELGSFPAQGPPELNPADIKSIVVLKDAGAAAIYGSRGANGVIIISTRRSHD